LRSSVSKILTMRSASRQPSFGPAASSLKIGGQRREQRASRSSRHHHPVAAARRSRRRSGPPMSDTGVGHFKEAGEHGMREGVMHATPYDPFFVRLSTLLYYDCLKPIEIDTATASYAVPEQPARRPLCTTKTSGVGDHSLWRRSRVRNDPTKQCDQNWNRHVDCGSTCGGRRPKSNTSRPET
jgi:hypothetical protein